MSKLPDDFNALLKNPDQYGGVMESIEVYTTANTLTVSSNNQLHIFLEGGDALDLRNSFLYFTTIPTPQTGGTYTAFQPCISSVMSRVRVLVGSTVLHDMLNFNLRYADYLMSEKVQPFSNTFNIKMATSDNLATREANFLSTTKSYCVDIGAVADFLNKIIPTMFLGQQIHIEITLEQPTLCLVTDGTNPNYALTNIQFHYRKLTLSENYKMSLKAKLMNGGLSIAYQNIANYSAIIQAGSQQIQNIIPFKYSRFTGLLCIARNQADVANTALDQKFTNIYQNYSVYNRSRLKLNNVYLPSDSIYNTVQAYENLLEYFDIDENCDTYIAQNWGSSPGTFQLGITCAQFPKNVVPQNQHICLTGMAINQASSNLTHEVVTSGIASGQEWQYFGDFFSIVTFRADGSVDYQE